MSLIDMKQTCRTTAVLALLAVLGACQSLGPNSVRNGRNDYNEAINNTALEETAAETLCGCGTRTAPIRYRSRR